MSPELHVRRAGQGAPVVLLHGLFGSGGNLGALVRDLQAQFSVYAPDLPGHGRSAWLEHYDLPILARRVERWLDDEGLERVTLVGHSLGGKLGMEMALRLPQRVRGLVVADIAPVDYPARHDEVFDALAEVAQAHCRSRKEAAEIMRAHLEEEGVIQFLLASLALAAGGEYDWRMDRAGLQRSYADLIRAPGAFPPFPGPVLFIKGENSDYIGAGHRAVIEALFPAAQLKIMPGCGHWLHVEKPELFNSIVRRFLDASS